MENCYGLILAAGEGTRMKSSLPKVMHDAAGYPLAKWVLEALKPIVAGKCIMVYGNGAGMVMSYFKDDVEYALQSERKGTGHAVMAAAPLLKEKDGYVLVVAGDVPLIKTETLKKLKDTAINGNCDAVVLSMIEEDPFGYGRIIRGADGSVERIVEHRDASEEERLIKEVNSSFYCFKTRSLLESLQEIKPVNAQGEYYLPDCIGVLVANGGNVQVVVAEDTTECDGVNDRVQLAAASKVLRRRINEKHMRDGVTMVDPDNTYIGAEVAIGTDTTVYPNVVLEGRTVIGGGCTLYPGSRILESHIGDNTTIQNSVIVESSIGDNCWVGPYANLRPHSDIGNNCKVGDFVEIKNSEIKDGAKVPHLSYIGDGYVGERSNIGCGVVFVNYNGVKKFRTVIEKDAFIGCNTNLVAPVTVGQGAYVAAGSTVTEDVPENALCIARARQVVKTDWKKPDRE